MASPLLDIRAIQLRWVSTRGWAQPAARQPDRRLVATKMCWPSVQAATARPLGPTAPASGASLSRARRGDTFSARPKRLPTGMKLAFTRPVRRDCQTTRPSPLELIDRCSRPPLLGPANGRGRLNSPSGGRTAATSPRERSRGANVQTAMARPFALTANSPPMDGPSLILCAGLNGPPSIRMLAFTLGRSWYPLISATEPPASSLATRTPILGQREFGIVIGGPNIPSGLSSAACVGLTQGPSKATMPVPPTAASTARKSPSSPSPAIVWAGPKMPPGGLAIPSSATSSSDGLSPHAATVPPSAAMESASEPTIGPGTRVVGVPHPSPGRMEATCPDRLRLTQETSVSPSSDIPNRGVVAPRGESRLGRPKCAWPACFTLA